MGLFDFLKKGPSSNKVFKSEVEKEMYVNDTMGYKGLKDKLDYHDNLRQRIAEIHANFKNSNDNSGYISALENIIKTDPESEIQVWLELVRLYVKEKKYDMAWGYLNKLSMRDDIETSRVRHEQASILKKEKRYIPAIDMIMSEHLLKYSNKASFHRDAFIKDAGVCTRALKWDDSMLDELADMVAAQLKSKDYDDIKLHDTYSEYLHAKGIIEEG